MALISLDGGRIFGERHGSGAPVVLALHGWGRSRSDFDGVLPGLDALALDLPGFGASPPPPAPWGAAEYARALEPVLDDLPEPPLLLGHSFGGRVAVAIAAARPLRSLVLTGVPLLRLGPSPRPALAYRLARSAHRLGLLPDGAMERIRRRRGSPDYRAASGVMREVLVRVVNESYEEELGAIRSPVRLVWGAGDREVPPAVAEAAAALLEEAGTDVVLRVLSGVGHHLPREAPAVLREIVEEELQR